MPHPVAARPRLPLTPLLGHATEAASTLQVLGRAGVIRPYGPRALAGLVHLVRGWGTGLAGGFASLALRHPHRVGLVDELGELTYGELHRRSNALARALAERGVREGGSVALMCRNHRGFVEASIAVAKLGADLLYLNTGLARPQLHDVIGRERPGLVIHDEEFADLLAGADVRRLLVAWTETDQAGETLEDLLACYDDADLQPPHRRGRVVVLTSGTTGTPKGASRGETGIGAAVAMLSRMPLRHGWRTHIAAPLFHTWGFAHLALAMLLGSTVVLRRTFDPEELLRTVAAERCESLVTVPVMLQRILALDEEVLDRHRLETLRLVAVSGSALPGDLATRWMDRFGDILYNVYGSTEVAYASIATPADLRAAPSSAGRPPHGTVVGILDSDGAPVPDGVSGRIFVGNDSLFAGYSDGGGKDVIDGLMSTGDIGRIGGDGRLYVEGREDEMIVSGGENVFPQAVEDCLAAHPAVAEVAVVGVPDADYGERLRACVVPRAEVDEAELEAHVRSRLARYQVPREIVLYDRLPRNATGKILKGELAERDVDA